MLPDKSGTTINSIPISQMGLVLTGPISIGSATAATSFVDVPGYDGSIDLTLRNAVGKAFFGRRDISIPLVAVGTKEQVAAAMAAIGAYNGMDVYVGDARFGGEWHGTMTLGDWTGHIESWTGQLSSTVTATVSAEPALYLPAVSNEMVFTGALEAISIQVDGNRPTWPTFTLRPTRTSNIIGIEIANSQGNRLGRVRYESDSYIANNVSVDCYMNTVTSNGVAVATSLYDDFPVLVSGKNTITFTGCASAEIAYRPRLMI